MKIFWRILIVPALLIMISACRSSLTEEEQMRRDIETVMSQLQELNPGWEDGGIDLLPSKPDRLRLLIRGNRINNFAPLEKFTIHELVLDRVNLTNLRPLAKLNIFSLMIFGTGEINLSGVLQMEHLRILAIRYMEGRAALNLKPLQGSHLNSLFVVNGIVTPPDSLPSLNYLTFENCSGLHDLSFLRDSKDLQTLELINCPGVQTGKLPTLALTELSMPYSPLSDSNALKRLYNLRKLTISNPQSLEFLRGMKLESLAIYQSANHLNLSVLKTMPLTKLELVAVPVFDLEPISECKELQALNLTLNEIIDIAPLRKLPLTTLLISGNAVENIDGLSMCRKLHHLSLIKCPVTSLIPLAKLPLRSLTVEKCLVSELAELPGTLEKLTLQGCPISDLTPLTTLKKLRRTHLQNLPALSSPLPEGIRGKVVTGEDDEGI